MGTATTMNGVVTSLKTGFRNSFDVIAHAGAWFHARISDSPFNVYFAAMVLSLD